MSRVDLDLKDGKLSVKQWNNVRLFICYEDYEEYYQELPAITKSEWEKLKKAGDLVFGNMEED